MKRAHRNDSESSSSNFQRRRPAHLRGREIGLYYANLCKQFKKQNNIPNRPIGTVYLSEKRKLEIEHLLGNLNKSNAHDFTDIEDSDFKQQFTKIISGSLESKLKNAKRKLLKRDNKLDEKYYNDLQMNKERNKMIKIREKLPSYGKQSDILNLINNNQIIVISGETGCGKTTQIPQFILDDFITSKKGSICKIVCTQPRRISAISVAERVAQERGEKCGESVGFQIRMEKNLPRESGSITFCTTGVLLKQMETDPLLSHISHLILDEIHERDITSDFIITLMKIIAKQSNIKLILMSATLNSQQFCKYFNDCIDLNIPGFTFPVTSYYLEDILSKIDFDLPFTPVKEGWKRYSKYEKLKQKSDQEFRDFIEPYVRNIRGKYSSKVCKYLSDPKSEELNLDLIFLLIKYICFNEPEGSILVFLPGFIEISKLHNLFLKSNYFPESRFLIILLHSKLPSVHQRAVFNRPPTGVRKIVIATNIAETSITIDDIIYVIDSSKIKMSSYNVEDDIEVLKTNWVSLANANQRKGRAGRVQPGICYHFFTKARQTILESFQSPEIQRSRLERVILTIKILQLGKAEEFLAKTMDPPDPQAIENSLRLLKQMNALTVDELLTPLGYHLAKLPMNPKMGKMILLGALFSCLDPILSIAASLDFKDAFVMPINKKDEIEEKKRELSNAKSDHLILAEALRRYEIARERGNERQFCWEYFLSPHTLELLRNMKSQFADYLCEMRFLSNNNMKSVEWNQNSCNSSLIKAIVCAALYPNVAIVRHTHGRRQRIKTTEDENVTIHPGSINVNERWYESPILVYSLKQKSSAIYLHDTTMVHPLPLIFFGDEINLEIINNNTIISLSNQLRFKYEGDKVLLIKDLREHLDNLLQYKISHPDVVNWMENNSEVSLLRAIIELITSEDLGEVNFEDYDDT